MDRSQGCMTCPVRGKHLFCNMEESAVEKFSGDVVTERADAPLCEVVMVPPDNVPT